MKVKLSVELTRIAIFFELLATGFFVNAPTGISIRQFLCNVLKLDPAYVDTRIQTIFLNGRAVDDMDSPLAAGSVVALSAAMPGLAGAAFRRSGAYSAMRSGVEFASVHPSVPTSRGKVLVKLFNQVAADLGISFFKNGIRLNGEIFGRFIHQRVETLGKICAFIEINGKRHPIDKLAEMEFDTGEVELIVVPT
jgi:hypothetical protein